MVDEKLPPHDIDAEEAVIGSLLIDGDAIRLVEHTIKPEDFYHEINGWLFKACIVLRSRREAINQVTVAQELQRNEKLEDCGGAAYLSHLISICPTSIDIEHYAQIVRRLSVSRQLINLGGQIASVGYNAEPNPNLAVDKATTIITDFRKSVTVFDELVHPKDAANIVLDMIGEYNVPQHRMSWGFRDLDELTSGIYPELIIFGARPSVGKTQMMLDVLENLAWHDKKILFCSAEMRIKAIMERKIARELKLDIRLLRKSGLPPDLMDKLVTLAGEVSERQVYYLPQGVSSHDIYYEASKLKETIGLDIVFVDYLQILKDCWQIGKENKVVLVGRAAKTLKSLSNDLQIPVICASQLSRDIERRSEDSKKPVLADLRECVTADTLIDCFDAPLTIGSIYENNLEAKVKTYKEFGGYEYVQPSSVLETGLKECLRITTRNGLALEVSVDTPLRTSKGWIKAKDLQIKDQVAIDISAPSVIQYNREDADVKKTRKGIRFNTGRTHFPKGHIPWNKGLNKETSSLVAQIAQKTSRALKNRPMPKPSNYSEIMRRTNPPMARKYDIHGYVWLYLPKYKGSKRGKLNWGRIYEHRYVMEQYLGRILLSIETIHHLDGNKENNDLNNLVLCGNVSEHTLLHQKEQKFVEALIAQGIVYYDEKSKDFKLR